MATPNSPVMLHRPRNSAAASQDLMPAHYPLWVRVVCLVAFAWAFLGWLNETWLFWFDNPLWLNRYTEYGIILGFGIWRIGAEKNPYTRQRLLILVMVITGLWWLIPWLYPFYEPAVGFLWSQPVFPSLHVPGTLTFFLVLALVLLFGRRVICGFGCPCVAIRETVGFSFREHTVRSPWAWRFRHVKWLFFIYYVGVMVVTQFPPNAWSVSLVGGFYLLVAFTYFGTFFLAPVVGNRFYCRSLCPYGATFGLLNQAGAYRIEMDAAQCNDCRRCESVCDMGIPVWAQGKQAGRVTSLEDCMGCARCVVACPTDALQVKDIRNVWNKSLVQNASYLLKRKTPQVVIPRQEPIIRAAPSRRKDWAEITLPPDFALIQAQASRCLDCGVPGCVNACPLHNRIPEWLEQVAAGQLQQAAELAHCTNNLPEICGQLCPQHRLCEGACTKAKEPAGAVTIGMIEAFLAKQALQQGTSMPRIIKPNGQRVAIIGAGPAGLACADEINKAGCEVTVYDRQPTIGGLLATGVPPFKFDKQALILRQRLLSQQGIHFKLGITINADSMPQLLAQHRAIFMATGAQQPRDIEIAGQHLDGVYTAMGYLEQVNANPQSTTLAGKQVMVLGGGDSAMDCARSAVRQGASRVMLAYRGQQADLRASPKEQHAALEEGVQFLLGRKPVAILGDTAVDAVCFYTDTDEHECITCEAVIFAVGQINQVPPWVLALGIATDAAGRIVIDAQGKTSHAQIYAGGDNTHGPDLVVSAIAAGRRAAQGILAQ